MPATYPISIADQSVGESGVRRIMERLGGSGAGLEPREGASRSWCCFRDQPLRPVPIRRRCLEPGRTNALRGAGQPGCGGRHTALVANELKLESLYDTRLPGQTTSARCRMRSPYRKTANGSSPPTPVLMPSRFLLWPASNGGRRPAVAWVPTNGIQPPWPWRAASCTIGDCQGAGNWAQQHATASGSRARLSKTTAASTYIATLLHGSLAAIDLSMIDARRQQMTRTVVETNMMKAAQAEDRLSQRRRTPSST